MEKQEPFWLLAVVLPLAGVFIWLCKPGDFTGLIMAGIAWLVSTRQGYEGGRRAVPIFGLLVLTAIAGLVVWAVKGRP